MNQVTFIGLGKCLYELYAHVSKISSDTLLRCFDISKYSLRFYLKPSDGFGFFVKQLSEISYRSFKFFIAIEEQTVIEAGLLVV